MSNTILTQAVKRRYTRQNREIVRTNTAQSARIRNLECEVTRLLNENLAWREEAISAKAEAEKWKAAHRLNREVVRMKEQLEIKLSEVNALVGELGSLPEKVARRSSQKRRRDGFVSELVKAEDREPRQRQTMLEQDGRLPAILEDKYYPRRTIEMNEIGLWKEDAHNEAGESPDIGPPPVAHFDEADAVVFDAGRPPRRTSTELIEESERACKPAVTIMENRRKRRTSSLLSNTEFSEADCETAQSKSVEKMDIEENAAQRGPEPLPSILRKGEKRKIEASELEDTSKVSKELDEFIFQRKPQSTTVPAARPSRFARPLVRTDEPSQSQAQSAEQPPRRILAPKSTNSPAKRKLADYTGSERPLKPVEPTRRVVSRIRARPVQTAEKSLDEQTLRDHALPPKTPAPELDDVLSPISAEPQQHQRLSKEAAITNSVEDVLNGSIGRGSRRARAAVSYAEPNLRDKMRRPGKELVSAIEGLSRQAESESTHARGQSEETTMAQELPTRSVSKRQPTSQDRSEPASPSRRAQLSTSERQGRKSIEAIEQSVFDPPQSSSPTAEDDAQIRSRHSLTALKTRRHSTQSTADPSSALRTRRPSSVAEIRRDDEEKKGHVRRIASTTTLPSSRSLKSANIEHGQSDRGSDSESQRVPRGGLSRRRSLMV